MQRDDVRDHQVLAERVRGDTLAEIGIAHGVSTQRAHALTKRAAAHHVTTVLFEMKAAQANGELYTLVIPSAGEPDQQLAVAYLDWLLRELDGLARVRVHYRPTVQGHIAFALEDLSLYDQNGSSQEDPS